MERAHLHPQFESFLKPMMGHAAWCVRQGSGSFLTLEFGEPAPLRGRPHSDCEETQRPHGAYHLWIYCCDWQIISSGNRLASSGSDTGEILTGLEVLEGASLREIAVEPNTQASTMVFADGLRLECSPYADGSLEEQWFVYIGSEILSFRSDGCFSISQADTPSGMEEWVRLAERP